MKNSIYRIVGISLMVLICGGAALRGKDYASLGVRYLAKNDFTKAVECFNKALAEDLENTSYLTMLGWSYFKTGNYDAAIFTFERLENVDPMILDAYTGRGWSYFEKFRFDQAIMYFEQAMEVQRQAVDPFAGMGWCSFRKGNFEKAEKYFYRALQKGIKYRPEVPINTSFEAYRGLGYLSFSKNNFKTALKHFKAAINFFPAGNDARIKWGDCLYALGDYKDAIVVYRHSLKYGKAAEIYDKLGWCYLRLSERENLPFKVRLRYYSTARRMLNKALALSPNYASSLSGLSKVFWPKIKPGKK